MSAYCCVNLSDLVRVLHGRRVVFARAFTGWRCKTRQQPPVRRSAATSYTPA